MHNLNHKRILLPSSPWRQAPLRKALHCAPAMGTVTASLTLLATLPLLHLGFQRMTPRHPRRRCRRRCPWPQNRLSYPPNRFFCRQLHWRGAKIQMERMPHALASKRAEMFAPRAKHFRQTSQGTLCVRSRLRCHLACQRRLRLLGVNWQSGRLTWPPHRSPMTSLTSGHAPEGRDTQMAIQASGQQKKSCPWRAWHRGLQIPRRHRLKPRRSQDCH